GGKEEDRPGGGGAVGGRPRRAGRAEPLPGIEHPADDDGDEADARQRREASERSSEARARPALRFTQHDRGKAEESAGPDRGRGDMEPVDQRRRRQIATAGRWAAAGSGDGERGGRAAATR